MTDLPELTELRDLLPTPTGERWQPLRAGLVDLYYYDDQEFWFHDGRLLLRGNNGAGKSKVLALLLPFLLDGETGGHRLEPDGDRNKKMEWNLLLGGEHQNAERTGYSWLELGRRDADGVEHHRTLGFGAKAAKGRGVVKSWFFTTGARVGVDLHLLDRTRTVLSQERLEAELASLGNERGLPGRVTTTARAHRAAVDEQLFGLGEQRYAALVDLLVQLRQPQLSRRPSEARLSDALTAALPPIDQAVLSDVAETFRSLEEDREALERTRTALGGARDFLGHYRSYARAASRRAARAPRQAHSAYERHRTELTEARAGLQDAEVAASTADVAAGEAAVGLQRAQARVEALASDPRMQAVEVLDAALRAAERAEAEADRSQGRADAAVGAATSAAHRAGSARSSAEAAVRTAADHARRADAEATTAGTPAVADLAAGRAEPLDLAAPPADLGPWRRAADTAGERRHRELGRLEELAAAQREADAAAGAAAREADSAASAADRLTAASAQAEQARGRAATDLLTASTAWLQGLAELRAPDPAAALAELEAWLVGLDGANPLEAVAAAARDDAVGVLVVEQEQRRRELAETAATAAELAAELTRLERGEHTPPAAPPTRDPAARAGAAGAPLWQLVELAPPTADAAGVTPEDAAGLEAALEGAGLLDAWVGPRGLRLTDDVVLHAPGGPGGRAAGRTLADVLVPSVAGEVRARGVDEAVVAGVLAAVALGAPAPAPAPEPEPEPEPGPVPGPAPGVVWVDVDGRFGTPVSSGSWHRATSEHLGAGARERARQARTRVVRSELAGLRQRELDLEDAVAALDRRRHRAAAEAGALPSSRDLLRAASDVLARAEQRDAARRASTEADQRRDAARALAGAAAAELTAAADDLALPVPADQRRAVATALAAWERGVERLLASLTVLAGHRRDAGEREQEAAAARDTADAAGRELTDRRGEAAAARETYDVQRRVRGLEAEQVVAERTGADHARSAARAAQEAAAARVRRAAGQLGAAQDRLRSSTEQVDAAASVRDAAVARWQAFAATGVLAAAVPAVTVPQEQAAWAPDPAVRLAREVERELDGVEDGEEVLTRLQNRVTSEQRGLDDVLALDGHRAWLRVAEDHLVVDVVFRGRAATLVELEAALATDVDQRTELLDARERHVIETYLIDEVASTLADLVARAEGQVERMNHELGARPTSTGMRLRLRWLPREDGPAGLDAARQRLLRQHADAWSPQDRTAVATFLSAQVDAVRAADPGGSWAEQLATALDYRGWHRFAVQRWQNGQWRTATGPASGGERVLAASVPLFAAAAAHYSSAPDPHAPRLVMLDEAFAGVDDTARASYLGLLAEFDLDVVMTSEREWGCYPSVPGLGIAQLSRLEGVDAVLVTPWRWDGRTRVRADVAAPGARLAASRATAPWRGQPPGDGSASGGAGEPGDQQDGLFG